MEEIAGCNLRLIRYLQKCGSSGSEITPITDCVSAALKLAHALNSVNWREISSFLVVMFWLSFG